MLTLVCSLANKIHKLGRKYNYKPYGSIKTWFSNWKHNGIKYLKYGYSFLPTFWADLKNGWIGF